MLSGCTSYPPPVAIPETLATADRVLDVAEHEDLTETLATTLLNKGSALASLGRAREGAAIIRAGEELAGTQVSPRSISGGSCRAPTGSSSRTPCAPWRACAKVLPSRGGSGTDVSLLRLSNNIGFTEFIVGQWDEGLATLEAPLPRGAGLEHPNEPGRHALVIRAFRGEPLTEELAALERLVGEAPDPIAEINLQDARGHKALADGRLTDARSVWHRMIALDPGAGPSYYYQTARAALWGARRDGARSDLAKIDATGVHGRVDRNAASHHSGRARGPGWPRCRIRCQLPRCPSRLAGARPGQRRSIDRSRHGDPPWASVPEVGPPAAAARTFFARVGARPLLARLDEAMGESEHPIRPRGEAGQTPADAAVATR